MFQRFSVMAGIEKEVRQIFIGQLWLCLKNPCLDAFLYKSDFFIFLFHCLFFMIVIPLELGVPTCPNSTIETLEKGLKYVQS